MAYREVMKQIDKQPYCEFKAPGDPYYYWSGQEVEDCPNKSSGKCLRCQKRYCTFHGTSGLCDICKR